MFKRHLNNKSKGSTLLFVLIFGSLAFTAIVFSISGYAIMENRSSNKKHVQDLSLQIAEAGINYYRWHLAHNRNDFTDGTGNPGPYGRDYLDKDGNKIGEFSLQITPPLTGSTVTAIESTGSVIQDPGIKRTIKAVMGAPALTDFLMVSNAGISFSFTTVVHGQVHSNNDIRFDGTTDSWVKSHTQIQGGGGPKSFWQYPVPEVDFFGVTTDLDNIRQAADISNTHYTSSGVEGYHLVFNGNTYQLYKVDTKSCYNGEGRWRRRWGQWYWDGDIYCYDIGTETLQGTYNIPESGAIFVEDNVWVEGLVDGRVTIGVGKFPVQEPYYNVFISNNLIYQAKASDDVVGIMAQGSIIVPHNVPTTMEIDAAMLSQFNEIGRPYYDSDIKDSLTVFGSEISYNGGGWKWVNGWGHVVSGFTNTDLSYDANLKFYPPPQFPVGEVYELISWEEILP